MENKNDILKSEVKSDDKFKAKARKLQSLCRHNHGWEMGLKPKTDSNEKLGSIILDGEINGSNFLLKETFQYAKMRVTHKRPVETIDSHRLFCNMLSSMPMCFNLFHPLSMLIGTEELNRAFQKLFPKLSIAKVTAIQIEFIPEPIKKYTNDKSAFDALATYETADQNTGIIAVETKYVEPLGSNKGSDKRTKLHIAQEIGMFTEEGLNTISGGCTQVYRNFLLTEAYRMRNGFDFSHSIILSPAENCSSYSEIAAIKESLRPMYCDKISFFALEDFVKILSQKIINPQENWIIRFCKRYLDFNQNNIDPES